MVRTLVRETLEREGYKVIDSADPVEAQRLADGHRGKIQLLITDVVMPKLSGKELARSLTHIRPDLKVLYMSGYTDSAIVNSGILQKEVSFLQKPFTPAGLSSKVREVIDGDPKSGLAAAKRNCAAPESKTLVPRRAELVFRHLCAGCLSRCFLLTSRFKTR